MVRRGMSFLRLSVWLAMISVRRRKVLLCSICSMSLQLLMSEEHTRAKVRSVPLSCHSYLSKKFKLETKRLIEAALAGKRCTNSITDSYSYGSFISGRRYLSTSITSPHLSLNSSFLR